MEEHAVTVRKDTDYIQQLKFMSHSSFFPRFISYLIDILVLWGVSQLTIVPLLTVFGVRDVFFGIEALSLENIATTLLYFIYFTLMTYFLKQTLGKMILGISVVSSKGTKLTFSQVFFRETIGRIISNFLLYLPYLAVLFTDAKIGLHDFIGDTYAVNNKYKEYTEVIQQEIREDKAEKLQEKEEYDHVSQRNF
ncbi:RDD family protein [Jeotgalicoccus aerolatus]|uniref:RDD family membrane protein YckC n=1 Tax=Jeotgalicoccus aerolatus TaxID=709510 RepID=A0ABS4HNN1_9STAP|nr:RDD family protein [Jeotgalicoccus aerolatus]MBP1952531.1 putative RDD family membrane protein YckC [Jeotgalicoccus aerolatus]NMA80355.1 RDD family protein [Jeotgalicoccus aerolatus]GGD92971.1 putative membrane protein YteJ [Jeotgalicoccus aerolatus]CAD2074611.1 RDD family protein [Jeotgalicoccus aerolatus]